MTIFGDTDIGKRRSNNQDNFRVRYYGTGAALAVVCDGMGGARGGAEASLCASDTFTEAMDGFLIPLFGDASDSGEGVCVFDCDVEKKISDSAVYDADKNCRDIERALVIAAKSANEAVYKRSQNDTALSGMGTTLVGAVLANKTAYVVNIGDSRLYHLNKDTVKQITHDHSYVQYLVDSGKMTYEESLTSSVRNIITRAVGIDSEVEADTCTVSVSEGDKLLLCSDGLTNHVPPEHFPVYTETDAENAVRALIKAANEAGGSDNITVVIASL